MTLETIGVKICGMKILLFDIDGTLIDSGGAGKLAMETAFASEFGVAKSTNVVAYAGRTDIAIITDMLNCYGVESSTEQIRRCLQSYLSHLPDSLKQRSGRTLPGVRQLLEQLSLRDDVLLGLLTGNVEEGARKKLCFFQLDSFFRCGGYADDFYDRNDVARFAHSQAKKHLAELGASENEVWVIGDTPHDVACARAIGARVLAVATGTYSVAQLSAAEADHVTTDLGDLERILSIWTNDQPDVQ